MNALQNLEKTMSSKELLDMGHLAIPSAPEAILYLKKLLGFLENNSSVGDYSEGYEILFLDSLVEKDLGKGFLDILDITYQLNSDDSSVSFKFKEDLTYCVFSEAKVKLCELLKAIVDLLITGLDLSKPHHLLKVIFADTITKKNKDCKPRPIITYLVKQTDANKVKIGRTRNLKQRLTDITNNCGSTLETLLLIPTDVEQQLHFRFQHLRHIGEWFIDNGDIALWVKNQIKQK